jgi:hypothetical protein
MTARATSRRALLASLATTPAAAMLPALPAVAMPPESQLLALEQRLTEAVRRVSELDKAELRGASLFADWRTRNPYRPLEDGKDTDTTFAEWTQRKIEAMREFGLDGLAELQKTAEAALNALCEEIAEIAVRTISDLKIKARCADLTGNDNLLWSIIDDLNEIEAQS